ncbi:MAG TPA: hypothetical protein VEL76_04530 [Gemmataceae bacterium]|nr:hypothetical protein [Gemmataceae bacterium]
MDEAAWRACTQPTLMLRFLRGRVSVRKLRLFAVACCRRVQSLMADERSRAAVDLAERRADGHVTEREVRAVRAAAKVVDDIVRSAYLTARSSSEPPYGYGPAYAACNAAGAAAAVLSADANIPASLAAYALAGRDCATESKEAADDAFRAATRAAFAEEAELLRDIVGTPFQPVPFDPAWRTPNVVALATVLYEDRRFKDMPVLADALEEAGCNNAGILAHCRQPGVAHTRGCWLIDLLLDKT